MGGSDQGMALGCPRVVKSIRSGAACPERWGFTLQSHSAALRVRRSRSRAFAYRWDARFPVRSIDSERSSVFLPLQSKGGRMKCRKRDSSDS